MIWDKFVKSWAGLIRGKLVYTTFSYKTALCPLDHVNRQFHALAPNKLWVSHFTYVYTWNGFVYVAFVIDVYARYIVSWGGSRATHASFVMDALEQVLYDRKPPHHGGLIHHSGLNYGKFRIAIRIHKILRTFGRSWHRIFRRLDFGMMHHIMCAFAVSDSYDCDKLPWFGGLTHVTIDCMSLR